MPKKQLYRAARQLDRAIIIHSHTSTLNEIITSNFLRLKLNRPLGRIRRGIRTRMRASPTVHFPPSLHIDILHANQRILVTMVPRV